MGPRHENPFVHAHPSATSGRGEGNIGVIADLFRAWHRPGPLARRPPKGHNVRQNFYKHLMLGCAAMDAGWRQRQNKNKKGLGLHRNRFPVPTGTVQPQTSAVWSGLAGLSRLSLEGSGGEEAGPLQEINELVT